jgi:ATP-binding cassette subfamily B protein
MLKELTRPFRYEKLSTKLPLEKKVVYKAKNQWQTIQRVWRYLAEKRKLLLTVIILVIASSILGILGPFLIGYTIDHYIVPQDTDGIFVQLLLLGVVYLLYSFTLLLQNYWMIGIAQDTVFKMRTQLFSHLQQLPIPFFDKRQYGELMSRVTNDMENVSSTLNSSVIQIFSSVLTLIGTISVMVYISPLLTLITLIIIPLMFYGMKWITRRTGVLFKEQQRHLGELNGFIEETISGQRIVKTFSQEKQVIEQFQDRNEKLKGAGFWALTFSGFIPKLMNFLNHLSFGIIAAIGGVFALNGMISIGAIVIFTEYSRQFTRPLNDLANQFNTILSAIAGAERVFEILDEDVEARDELNTIDLERLEGRVEFQNVSFSYEDSENTLNNISIQVEKGECIALVGPTGAGKTTVLNLLTRFYEPTEGDILIDGMPINQIRRASLRQQMAFVLQDTVLFKASVMENIRYGRLDATDEEVIEAAKQANSHSFIEKLPEKYETILSQDGGGISQGQRQLLAIARAILANPAILILDEATSSIDTVTEIKIQEALERLMEGRTSFIIAHRLNTVRHADQIIVLADGEIIERGNHQALLKANGDYAALYTSQFAHMT